MKLLELKKQVRSRAKELLIELTTPRLTVIEIAKKLGVSRATIYNFKNGVDTGISDELAEKLLTFLETKEEEK